MKICQINGGVFGSTGKIMFGIANVANLAEMETLCFSPVTSTNRRKEPDEPYIKIGNYYSRRLNVLLGRITGFSGCFAPFATLKLLRRISKFQPDVIHLHNLHDGYINLPMLFRYIKKHNIRTIWTLHDCWGFTGHCPYFTMVGCDRWKTECYRCPQYKEYPKSYVDQSKMLYRLKKKWFTGVSDLTIVTPSQWLVDIVKLSFLKDYPIRVINNGIDLEIFCPTKSNFRTKYGFENKKIVLGVAFGWSDKKGLDVFVSLSGRLPENYQIVLVGTDDAVDKQLPDNICSIHRTQNQRELAEIYFAADVFVNPTREDNFPTVNIEALACGTPVVTFQTGGSPESIDETCGIVVPCDDIEQLKAEIVNLCEAESPYKQNCLIRAKQYEQFDKFKEYIKLYKDGTDGFLLKQ